ncbi:MAG: acetyl-CoA carboxylase carboxyltransferase subunit alpha [bacterium]|nr:acetyl-CoA carboxylase carboxyltransferase subunit alpha [bacterium]MDD5354163.1 acetyl-CoA carboxylase carboxyltransferase subunit alpha [bacterium]MDD5756989.1 acetyl-CoA carboxylase carboxyltransferase subunit alpha [bacterium]
MALESVLDFERPISELEQQIEEVKSLVAAGDMSLSAKMGKLEAKLDVLKKKVYGSLSPWQKVQLARHPQRPYTQDYIKLLMTDFLELHGDRKFADDLALLSGLAYFEGIPVLVLGQQKGRNVKENLEQNFGMMQPEGYRKALRLMQMAEKFNIPVITFVDTPGAYPGIGAEERGQAEAIAHNLYSMSDLKTPIIVIIIGEGGSGGALGIGVGDKVYMLENSIYSVISPEGCASILWRDASKAALAAETMKITAKDCLNFKVIDDIIPEPLGGAHHSYEEAAENIRRVLRRDLKELVKIVPDELIKKRYEKIRAWGAYKES